MNTAEFIAELNERLAVLTDEERRDILNEYEQHIDMKAASGISEEEVIADFGRIEDLTANILEAYHVRADYVETGNKRKLFGKVNGLLMEKRKRSGSSDDAGHMSSEAGEAEAEKESSEKGRWAQLLAEIKGIAGKLAGGCRALGRYVGRGFDRLGNALRSAAGRCRACLKRLFGRKKEKAIAGNPDETAVLKREEVMLDGQKKQGFWLWRGIAKICGAIWSACCWCVKWMWNLFCAGSAILFGLMACLCIFGLGVLIVLLVLGYPVWGVTIGCLGMTLCMTAVAVFFFTAMILKKGKRSDKGEEKIYA